MKRLLGCWLLAVSLSAPAYALEVLATIRPLALIAHAVAIDPSQVRQLLPDGESAHHPSLRPSDRKALVTADIVLRVGPVYDAFLDRALAARKGEVLNAQALPNMLLLKERQRDGSPLAHAHDDPHIWLQPDNAVRIALALAEAMAKKDARHAAMYRQNAKQFAERIKVMKQELAAKVSPHPYMAYHDAYQYLESLLKLQFRGSLTADAESKPGARHFQLMAKRISQEKIGCLLAEPGFDEALVKRVAGKNILRSVAVDEMFTEAEMSAEGYVQGLQKVATEIERCTKE